MVEVEKGEAAASRVWAGAEREHPDIDRGRAKVVDLRSHDLG
jgi:hypothetical protein